MSFPGSLDGNLVFGVANHIVHTPRGNAQQVNAFFGVNGNQTIFGGARGRTFMIDGVFLAANPTLIATAEAFLLSYADGRPHTLVDTYGRIWQNIIFRGEYQPNAAGPKPLADGTGWSLAFKCVLEGLT
jgi:hypothetical protein